MAPINLPDGSEVSEIILPDGTTASSVIAPDGSTVFSAIPDSQLNPSHRYIAAGESLSDQDTMSSFTDQSGGDNLPAVNAPTYISDGIGGEPAADLSATPDYFAGSFSNAISAPYTVVCVLDPADTGLRACWDDNSNTINGVQLDINQDNAIVRENGDFDANISVSLPSGPLIVSARLDDGNNLLRINGTSATPSLTVDGSLSGAALGYDTSDNRRPINGPYAEWLIDPSSVSDADIQSEEQRLANYYGITI